MTIIEDYYNQICSAWNYTPTELVSTGYEEDMPRLQQLTKDVWTHASDAGKAEIEDEVFGIYRNREILPINYYSLDGCRQQILDLKNKSTLVENGIIGVGNTSGQSFCRFWFQNMQDARVVDNPNVSLYSRFHNDRKLRRAIRLCYKYRNEGDKTVIPQNLRRALELVNGGTIQNFKPMNARAVWEYICPNFFGRVLDFSSGYGGRMLGAMTSNMRYHYTGIDPNTDTFKGLDALGSLVNEVVGTDYEMYNTVSEEFDPEAGAYDAAFSSPPYFNLEIYTDEPTQCMNRYTNMDAWFEYYVEPTLRMLHKGLADDGIYAVNIADYKIAKEEFKILDRWLELSEKMGFEYQETVKMMLNTRPGVGNGKMDRVQKFEGVYIFKRK
jgi:hypothetical protein